MKIDNITGEKVKRYRQKIDFWDCQLGRNMGVGRDLWQPYEMLVGQTTRLTAHSSTYIKFENVIGLEMSRKKFLLQMTYNLTWLKMQNYMEKEKMLSIFGRLRFIFSLLCCQFLSNLKFKYRCRILFFNAKNHEKLIFEYWFALSWNFLA